ncbi:MAG: hypothetical protein JOZ89_01305, partial [Gammaproteobacteria bacterium]|nr:hypothetical protein [Gammaproteobacteria bacterium]
MRQGRPARRSLAALLHCASPPVVRTVFCLAGLSGGAALLPAVAAAQQATQPSSELQEVVVTATKRTT